jgi:hypothetical protein
VIPFDYLRRSRAAVASLASEAVWRAGSVGNVFHLVELDEGLLSKFNHSVHFTQITVMLGFHFGEGAVYGGNDCSYKWVDGADADDPDGVEGWRRLRTSAYMLSGGTVRLW